MPVANELPRLVVCRCETQPDDDVVEPALELGQQFLAGDAFPPDSLLEIGAKLAFENAVHSLHLLFFSKLEAVSDNLGLAGVPVLTRRDVAFLNGAGRLEAAFPLEEQLHCFSAAQTANRSSISSQFNLLYLASGPPSGPHNVHRLRRPP